MLAFACILVVPAFADNQPAAPVRRPLAAGDFDVWRSISSSSLTRDGRWLGYSYMPLEGDGEIVLRELATRREHRVPVGALPPPPLTASEENPERPAPRREVTLAFTSDGRFAVATAFPSQAATLAAKRAKKKADELPKEGLVIVELATGATTRLDAVKNFQVPARGSAWLAWLREPPPAEKKDDNGKKKDRKYGSDLVLRDLAAPADGAERTFCDVLEYSFARDGRTLLFAVSSRAEAGNGVYAVTPGDPAPPVALAAGPGRYQKISWDRTQSQAAFVSDRAEPDAKAPRFALYHWPRGTAAAVELVSPSTPGVPAGWSVSGDHAPAFSFDGRKLHVLTAPAPEAPDEQLEALLDEEKVTADLWRWNDDFIPPVQKVRADRERKRAYLGVLDLASRGYVQLGDPSLPAVMLNDDATVAFGLDDRDYRRRFDHDGVLQDLHLVDAATGARRLIRRELDDRAGPRWSPNGRWLAFYQNREWFAVDARDGSVRSLTAGLTVAFHDELADRPEQPAAYGSPGWTRDGDSLVLYDRFDLWQVFPDGRPARNLTAGHGRAHRIQFRVQPIEPAEPEDDRRGLDPAQPLTLRGESEDTRASGYFRTTFDADAAPRRLLWADKNLRYAGRAQETDTLLLSASRFDEYPDLHTTTGDFTTLAKVTDGGSQLAPFLWGSAELLRYRNADGVELSAALYKPANFDPTKKYPMIVYIYERLTQIVHHFYAPLPSHYLNHPFYASNGYLVLMPDIAYTVGRPGDSAVKCVLPAVDEVVRRGFVDESAIGLQGHSWGGYQAAYLVTRTNRFRAIAAGAIVSNMTSAYSGIRLGSGRTRQYLYEEQQSRLGQSLSEAPELYLENSPVFAADRVQTPLLLLHNDQDDAVPWSQGIEFFLALRRLDREAYLFDYNGEKHGLRRRIDQKDYARRMHQFFDHFLKSAGRPAWMADGIPFLDRDGEKLRFRTSP